MRRTRGDGWVEKQLNIVEPMGRDALAEASSDSNTPQHHTSSSSAYNLEDLRAEQAMYRRPPSQGPNADAMTQGNPADTQTAPPEQSDQLTGIDMSAQVEGARRARKRWRLNHGSDADEFIPLSNDSQIGMNSDIELIGNVLSKDNSAIVEAVGGVASDNSILPSNFGEEQIKVNINGTINIRRKPQATEDNNHISGSLNVTSGSNILSVRPEFTPEEIRKRITARVSEQSEITSQVERRLGVLQSEHLRSAKKVQTLQTDLDKVSRRYDFFERVRIFLVDVCSCLQEKRAMLVDLDGAQRKILSEASDLCTQQRESDLLDCLDRANEIGFDVQVTHATSNMNVEYQLQPWGKQNGLEANNDKQVDEFGRSTNLAQESGKSNTSARVEREKILNELWDQCNGDISIFFSRNVLLSKDVAERARDREVRLLEAAKLIFDDVREDLRNWDDLIHIFIKWSKEYHDDFQATYAALSLPALMEPYARMRVLQWNPLSFNGNGDRTLMQTIYDSEFGFKDHLTEQLVCASALVMCAMPRLKWHITDLWDPMGCSLHQTQHLFSSTNEIGRFCRLLAKHTDWDKGYLDSFKGIVDSILVVLQSSASELSVPLLVPGSQKNDVDLSPAQHAITDEPIRRLLRLAISIVQFFEMFRKFLKEELQQDESLLLGKIASCLKVCTRFSSRCKFLWQQSDTFGYEKTNLTVEGKRMWHSFLRKAELAI